MTAAECITNTAIISKLMWEAGKKAVDETTHEIFLISTENFCPVDTGALKASAKETVKEDSGEAYTKEISYGNSEVNYSWWVHELPYRHYNPPNAQNKYLEVPLNLYSDKLQKNVSIEVSGVIDN